MNIAYFDLETSPLVGYTWGKYEQNVLGLVKDSYIMCFAVKWNNGKTKVYKKPDFKTYRQFVKKLWNVFNEADILVAHNGDKFDIKKSNTEFIKLGFKPPAPYKTIDTLKWSRRLFKFDSNKLDDLGEYLKVGRKVQTGGFKLWTDCIDGEPRAWVKMGKYNKQDVELLYRVYEKLKSWSNNHPNINVLEGKDACPVCGSKKLQRRGFNMAKSGKTQRFQCTNCYAWCSSKTTRTTNIK